MRAWLFSVEVAEARGLEGGRRDCSTDTYTDRVPCYALRNATRRCNGSRDLRAVCRDSTPVRPPPAARSARAAEGHPRQPPPPRTPTSLRLLLPRPTSHNVNEVRANSSAPAARSCCLRDASSAAADKTLCKDAADRPPVLCRPRCIRCHRRLHRPTWCAGTRACRPCPHPNHVILFRRPF